MDSTENSTDTGRRSTRIRAQILVRVTSLDPATPFSESGHTLVVNTQGCGVRLSRSLEPGLAVSLDDLPAGQGVTARIANCVPLGSGGQWWMVGIALDEPGNVWGIHPTPADWGSRRHDCRCGRRNRTGREPGQERRMALPPILQPRRISPRQKIESRCAWRNWPPTKTLACSRGRRPSLPAVIPTGAKRSGGTCFPPAGNTTGSP